MTKKFQNKQHQPFHSRSIEIEYFNFIKTLSSTTLLPLLLSDKGTIAVTKHNPKCFHLNEIAFFISKTAMYKTLGLALFFFIIIITVAPWVQIDEISLFFFYGSQKYKPRLVSLIFFMLQSGWVRLRECHQRYQESSWCLLSPVLILQYKNSLKQLNSGVGEGGVLNFVLWICTVQWATCVQCCDSAGDGAVWLWTPYLAQGKSDDIYFSKCVFEELISLMSMCEIIFWWRYIRL